MYIDSFDFDSFKRCAYDAIGAGLAGKLFAGAEIYGVVIIPTGADFLSGPNLLTCAAVAPGFLIASSIVHFVVGKIFNDQRYDTIAGFIIAAANLGILFQIAHLTRIEPIQTVALTALGFVFQRGCEMVQKGLIKPYCNETIYQNLKYVLPKTHISRI